MIIFVKTRIQSMHMNRIRYYVHVLIERDDEGAQVIPEYYCSCKNASSAYQRLVTRSVMRIRQTCKGSYVQTECCNLKQSTALIQRITQLQIFGLHCCFLS